METKLRTLRNAKNSNSGYKIYEIKAGEGMVTTETNAVLSTILGSCVAVCLFDQKKGVIGLKHFKLKEAGNFAVDKLIKEMIAAGAEQKNLKAKIFGADRIMEPYSRLKAAESNTENVKSYLSFLNIQVIAENLGSNWGRKLFFFSQTKDVLLNRITG